MDLLRTWRLLRAYRWRLLLLTLTAVLASVAVSYAVPERYRATTLVLVHPQEKLRLEAPGSEKEILSYPLSPLAPVDVPSRTYIEVIRSAALAERVVQSLGLDQRKASHEQSYWRRLWTSSTGRLLDAAGDVWLLLKYGHMKKRSPLQAAVTNLQKNLAMAPIRDSYLFQITYEAPDPHEAAAVANAAASVLVDYLTTTGRTDSSANRRFLEDRVKAAAATVAAARADLQEFKDAQATFALDEEYKSGLTTISKLRGDLEKIESHLQGLLKTHTAAHPKVESLVAQRNRLRQSIATLAGARSPLAEKEKELGELGLRLRIAEGDYSVVSKSLAEARIDEANQANEVRVVSPAQPPTYPVGPIKVYFALAAALAALLLGATAILFGDSLRARVRCIDDAQRLGLPVLATFPVLTSRSNA